MQWLIGIMEVWSRRRLDYGGGKVEGVEQVVQALPTVAGHDGNCSLNYIFFGHFQSGYLLFFFPFFGIKSGYLLDLWSL